MSVIEEIYTAPTAGEPTVAITSARAVPGRGLEGDRYFLQSGSMAKKKHKPKNDITFIEAESIEAVCTECGIHLTTGETRRNIVTRGVRLNALVGKHFRVGDARFLGIEPCDPCGYLERLTRPGVKKALVGRGGLRAQILSEGVCHVGDAIVVDHRDAP